MCTLNSLIKTLYKTLRPGTQYDASTMSVTSIMSVAEKNLYVPSQNGIFNLQNFDNLIGWTLETLYTRNRNQLYSSINLVTHTTQRWRHAHRGIMIVLVINVGVALDLLQCLCASMLLDVELYVYLQSSLKYCNLIMNSMALISVEPRCNSVKPWWCFWQCKPKGGAWHIQAVSKRKWVWLVAGGTVCRWSLEPRLRSWFYFDSNSSLSCNKASFRSPSSSPNAQSNSSLYKIPCMISQLSNMTVEHFVYN